MPNYINPFSFSSIRTISPTTSSSLMGTISSLSPFSALGSNSANRVGSIADYDRFKSGANTFGNSSAIRSKLNTKFNSNANTFGGSTARPILGNGKYNSFNSGSNTFGGSSAIRSKLGNSFNSGSNTFGGSNVSSSNNRSFNNYGRIETSLTSTFKKKPTTKRYGYGSASIY
jgi:hypothetical protein